jgi:hypothetical protein
MNTLGTHTRATSRAHLELLAAGLLLCACGAGAAERPARRTPSAYPGTCTLIEIAEVAAPADQETDVIALVARYRFGAGERARGPFALQFEIARPRARELWQHLSAQPTVVCSPDAGGQEEAPHIALVPFEGQAGRPLPQPPPAEQ